MFLQSGLSYISVASNVIHLEKGDDDFDLYYDDAIMLKSEADRKV